MDVSDGESSEAGSSVAAARPDASYFRDWDAIGFDPHDETLLKFEAIAPGEAVEERKDSPIRRCTSVGVSTEEESQEEQSPSMTYTVETDLPTAFAECKIQVFDEEDLEKLLEAIHGPEEWQENGKNFSRKISKDPPDAEDALNLQVQLDQMLAVRLAKPSGVCPIRQSIYDDCFNEVIRQVTLGSNAHCGQLLLRCRDEIRYTKGAYLQLYESSETFRMRKSLRRDTGGVKRRLDLEKNELESITGEWNELKEQLRKTIKSNTEESEKLEKECKEELDYLNQNNARFKKLLDVLTKPGGLRLSLDESIGKSQDPKDTELKSRPSELKPRPSEQVAST